MTRLTRALAAAATALFLAGPAPAAAEKLDLSTVSCKQFLESGKENIAFILMWLHGYWTDEDDPPVVDFDRMKTDAEKLGEYCAKNPASGLITAANDVLN